MTPFDKDFFDTLYLVKEVYDPAKPATTGFDDDEDDDDLLNDDDDDDDDDPFSDDDSDY